MKHISALFLLFVIITSAINAQPDKTEGNQILGIWLTGNEKAKVEIFKCEDEYCGKIVWLREPTYEDGSIKRDKKNPDESMHSRQILGLLILNNFEYDDDLVLMGPTGCSSCTDTGYAGRTGLHELLQGTDTMKRMIMQKNLVEDLRKQAISDGMTTLKQDGIWKVFKGDCDLKQVLAVCIV